MIIQRLTVLHTALAALLVTSWFTGILPVLVAADKFHALPVIISLTMLGVLLAALRRYDGATWLADKLPGVGLAYTVIGFLWAAQGDMSGDGFKRDIMHALIGNLAGIVGYFWVEFNILICKQVKV